MALNDLATVADLTDRDMDTTNVSGTRARLASATSAVRNAAGVPITRETFTVTVPGRADEYQPLPGQPVVIVSDVLIDDVAVTDWKLIGGKLWRRAGWELVYGEPSNVTATITGGLFEVPEDIVDLVCALVGLAAAKASGGAYSARGDLTGIRIDDYSEQYNSATGQVTAGPLELPKATRDWLRKRFGGGAELLRSR